MRRLLPLALAALVSACVPTEFEDLRGEAQVIGFEKPEDLTRVGLGQVLAGYGATLGGAQQSRVVASAGENAAFVSFDVVLSDEIRPGDVSLSGCLSSRPCPGRSSLTLVGIDGWRDEEMCVANPSQDTGAITIACESGGNSESLGPGGVRFGTSGARIPGDHPVGRALFGAPGADPSGGVYRLPDGDPPIRLDITDGLMGGSYGTSLAAAVVDADTVMFATAGTAGRVIVGTVASDGMSGVTTTVIGCIDGSTPAFGASLAVGDLNGDGTPDVAVSSGSDPMRLAAVQIYDGAAAPGCGTAWDDVVEIACPQDADDTIECDLSEFGLSLATGDLTGDGIDDLVVGAPLAEVDGTPGAGAVYVFAGNGALDQLTSTRSALRHPSPESNATLGLAVATVPGLDGRFEFAAGAPGDDRVYLFLCSGLEGDSPDTTPEMRCQPR